MAKFDFNALSKEQKQTLIMGVVMVCVLTYVYLKMFWIPLSQKIDKAREATRAVEDKIAAAQQESRHLQQLELEMQALSAQTVDAEKRLPRNKDLPAVFDTVNRLAQRYKVDMTTFAPGNSSTQTYFISNSYQITITGKYHDIGRFFSAIATQERIYNVQDVSYNLAPTDLDKTNLNVTATLLAYQYKSKV
jgi:Tfp pilus assembly protein PilO